MASFRSSLPDVEVPFVPELEEVEVSTKTFKRKTPKDVTSELHVTKELQEKLCKHGAAIGLCKFGCKK